MRRSILVVLLGAFVVSACGGSAPNSPSPQPGANSATISGTIVTPPSSGSSSAGAGHTLAMPGTVITIVGTNISAVADKSGKFTLAGVPNGDVQLKFTATGLNATLNVSGVQANEQITLSVSISGSTLQLESQRRNTGGEEQLEGRVEAIPAAATPFTFVVAGRNVLTDAETRFYLQGASATAAALLVGQRVHITGQPSGTALLASVVQIQNTNTEIQVTLNGTIQNFTPPVFEFTIDGQRVVGDSATEFFGGSSFAQLANGRRAEVKGLQRNGFVQATRIHVNVDDDVPPPGQTSASIEGLLVDKNGVAPDLVLTVGTTTVRTTQSTALHRRGDVQPLSVLAVNMTLHVVGTRQADGSIDARMIQIKDDPIGGPVQISGSAGGVKGSCPNLTFGVNGYDVYTNSSTGFLSPCADLKSGTKVTVTGVMEAGKVRALTVIKQ